MYKRTNDSILIDINLKYYIDMNNEILALRKALVHYEECVDVGAAEHIIASSLISLNVACQNVKEKCDEMITTLLK